MFKQTTAGFLSLVMLLGSALPMYAQTQEYAGDWDPNSYEEITVYLEPITVEDVPFELLLDLGTEEYLDFQLPNQNILRPVTFDGLIAQDLETLLALDGIVHLEADALARPRMGDWFFSHRGFITQPGGSFFLTGLHTFGFEEIHLELRTPADHFINYDLQLVEIFPNGHISVLDWSDFRTTINHQTGQAIPETIGFFNNSPQTRHFGAIVHSVEGFSATEAFTLNVGIAPSINRGTFHNPWQAMSLNLNHHAQWSLQNQFVTRAENHWYRLVLPANRNFDGAYISLDQNSRNAGHILEVFGLMSGIYTVAGIDNRILSFTNLRTYYIRVGANGRVTGQRYTLHINTSRFGDVTNPGGGTQPGQPGQGMPTGGQVTSITGPGVLQNANLRPGHPGRPRVNASTRITINGTVNVNGTPAGNRDIYVRVRNSSWTGNASLRYRTQRVRTLPNGTFTAFIDMAPGIGDGFVYPAGATLHLIDFGAIEIHGSTPNPAVRPAHERPIYILARTTF